MLSEFWGNRMYMLMLSALDHCLSCFCTGMHLSLHYDMWACPVWGCLCSIEDIGLHNGVVDEQASQKYVPYCVVPLGVCHL